VLKHLLATMIVAVALAVPAAALASVQANGVARADKRQGGRLRHPPNLLSCHAYQRRSAHLSVTDEYVALAAVPVAV
jgi:hypothetical protein